MKTMIMLGGLRKIKLNDEGKLVIEHCQPKATETELPMQCSSGSTSSGIWAIDVKKLSLYIRIGETHIIFRVVDNETRILSCEHQGY